VGKRFKRPIAGAHVGPAGRNVRTAVEAEIDWGAFPITWHFRYLDQEGPFGWHVCDRNVLLRSIWERARSFETKTWRELRAERVLHHHPLGSLGREALSRLAEIGQDLVDGLYSLHIGKRERIWGIQDRLYFKVIWWDPNHQVYPMNITNN
jgi:hypothetical protein